MEQEKSEEEKLEIPDKFKELVEKIENLSVLDLAELVKILEKRFGVTSVAQFSAVPVSVPTNAQAVSPAEEKTVFNVFLTAVGDKKLEVIKVIRDITEKGLKESKDLVDAAANSPQLVKENVKKEEAEDLKKKLEATGAKVELK